MTERFELAFHTRLLALELVVEGPEAASLMLYRVREKQESQRLVHHPELWMLFSRQWAIGRGMEASLAPLGRWYSATYWFSRVWLWAATQAAGSRTMAQMYEDAT